MQVEASAERRMLPPMPQVQFSIGHISTSTLQESGLPILHASVPETQEGVFLPRLEEAMLRFQ